jgi:hypothetical protein
MMQPGRAPDGKTVWGVFWLRTADKTNLTTAGTLNQAKGLNCGLIDGTGDEQAVVALIICECGARG